ncbi:MAG: ABC transporter permease [Caldilineae bacterium]|nr:MAG: ABC transporter permease [Caldilineae bacterium]
MMSRPLSLRQIELLQTRRALVPLVVKLLYPGLTVMIMLAGRAPHHIAASVIVLLIAFMSVVDLGLLWVRDRRSGLLARLALTPLSAQRIVLDRFAAAVITDLLQTLPIVGLLAVFFGSSPGTALILVVALATTLICSNTISLAVTLLPGGRREVILYAVITVFALLFLGGVFRPIGPAEGLLNALAHLIPYAPLHQAVRLAMNEKAMWSQTEILVDSLALAVTSVALLWTLAARLLQTD